MHCLAGENGSGKSTLIKIISGVVRPTTLSAMAVDGQVVTDFSAHQSTGLGIQVIYQDLSLFPNLMVYENISFRSQLGGTQIH